MLWSVCVRLFSLQFEIHWIHQKTHDTCISILDFEYFSVFLEQTNIQCGWRSRLTRCVIFGLRFPTVISYHMYGWCVPPRSSFRWHVYMFIWIENARRYTSMWLTYSSVAQYVYGPMNRQQPFWLLVYCCSLGSRRWDMARRRIRDILYWLTCRAKLVSVIFARVIASLRRGHRCNIASCFPSYVFST